VAWAKDLAEKLSQHPQFEIVTAPVLSLFTFRLIGRDDAAQIAFVNRINDDGRIYITQTNVDGQIAVRFQIGQFDVTQDDVQFAYDVICELAS
jgi:aromatic-L-amino-acid decarboxylase